MTVARKRMSFVSRRNNGIDRYNFLFEFLLTFFTFTTVVFKFSKKSYRCKHVYSEWRIEKKDIVVVLQMFENRSSKLRKKRSQNLRYEKEMRSEEKEKRKRKRRGKENRMQSRREKKRLFLI